MTMDEWIAAYDRKNPNDPFQRDERFALFYQPDHGFCEVMFTDKMTIIGQMAGDERYWRSRIDEAARKADPVLLEPMMKVEIVTPEDYLGDVMGDVSRRRGILQGQDDSPSGKIINAMIPLGEMFGYATTLRSMTQGRATYTMEFKHYSEAPKNVA